MSFTYVDDHASRAVFAVKLGIEVKHKGSFNLRHPSENLAHGARSEGPNKVALGV